MGEKYIMHQNIIGFKKASRRETKQPGQKIAGCVGHRPLGHLNEAEEKNKQKINKRSSFRKISITNANEKQKNEEEGEIKRRISK